MPFKIEKVGKGRAAYEVITTAGKNKGHAHSKHPLSRMMAVKQLRALYYVGADKK